MSIQKRLNILLIFLDIALLLPLSMCVVIRYYIAINYPLAKLIEPFYSSFIAMFCFYGHFIVIPAFILSYLNKRKLLVNIFFYIAILTMFFMFVIGYNEYRYLHISKKYFNPETVQSTMVEIDLQQLEDLQNNGETTMIYFGRPSCAHCNEIKPNLDILVNNSHSKVYYYNTEQDRDDNHDEMQTVLDTYGVEAVPALVVWADAGETQEIYFNEDVVDYFLDTSRFSY